MKTMMPQQVEKWAKSIDRQDLPVKMTTGQMVMDLLADVDFKRDRILQELVDEDDPNERLRLRAEVQQVGGWHDKLLLLAERFS